MSTDATDPKAVSQATGETNGASIEHAPVDKGKGKVVEDVAMDEDDEDEDEDDEEEAEDEDEEMAEEDSLEEIDVAAIQPRRTRGVRIDYSSAEALAKAGLKPGDNVDEDDQNYTAKDAEMDE